MDKYYFTNTEFKNNYKSLLFDFLKQHIDNEIDDFNKLQIEKYRYGLNFIEVIVHPYNFDEMPSYIDFELFRDLMDYFKIDNHGIESYQDFYLSFENKNFEFSLDMAFDNKYNYLIGSWGKIIDFLKDDTKTNLLANDIISIKKLPNAQPLLFNPNHFNSDCYNLFNYLVDNYSKNGKIKFINIYYFLKIEVDKNKYRFNFIQNDFTTFINTKYQIEINKYQKAQYDFEEQIRILNSLEEQFRKQ